MQRLLSLLTFMLISCVAFGQTITSSGQFFDAADAFFAKHVDDGMVDYKGIKASPGELTRLVAFMETYDPTNKFEEVRKAFWINAYNITTIKSIVEKYPIASPLDDPNFFTVEKHKVGGEMITLSDIEKKKLMAPFKDERLHFVLVCAAKGCPPLASFAFRPEKIESQIKERTKVALNDPYFVRVSNGEVKVSQIFTWYQADFDATGKSTLEYVNQYRDQPLPAGTKVSTYEYDWKLNEEVKKKPREQDEVKEVIPTDNPPPAPKDEPKPPKKDPEPQPEEPEPVEEATQPKEEQPKFEIKQEVVKIEEPKDTPWIERPVIDFEEEKVKEKKPKKEPFYRLYGSDDKSLQNYTPSRLYTKGEFEFKWFNNLYTQKAFFNEDRKRTDSDRATYFTSFFQLLVGLHPRVNIGADIILKSVRTNPDRGATALEVFGFQKGSQNQTAISAFGPKIKFIPIKKVSNLSIQSALHIPGAIDMEGRNNEKPFLEYDKLRWWNQIFYDKRFSKWANLFAEADLIIYFAGSSQTDGAIVQMPLSLFYSIFPTNKLTAYASGQYWPTLGDQSAYFLQMGLGVKYQLTNWLDMEVSYTNFVAGKSSGAGQTFNLGLRFVRFR